MSDGMQSIFLLITFLLSIGSLAISWFLFQKLKRMQEFFDTILTGRDIKDLEGLIKEISSKTDKLDTDIEDLFAASNQINQSAKRALNKVGVVKFNPFQEKGGRKDSFSVAFLNSYGKGVVISTLDTENGTKVYLKEVFKFTSSSPLTEEEKEAIKLAIK